MILIRWKNFTANDLEKIKFPKDIVKKLIPYLRSTDISFENLNEAKEKLKYVIENIE